MPEINEQHVFRLNITNRFGNEIAEHLNVVIPDANIHTYPEKRLFQPVILLYKNEEDIYPEYKKIVREYEDRVHSFKESAKEDKVLVWARTWSSIVKKGIPYKDKKQKKLKSVNEILKSLIIDFIAKKTLAYGENLSEAKMWISKHNKITELNTTF